MRMEVTFWQWASNDAEGLFGANCFENKLLNTLNEYKDDEEFNDLRILVEATEKLKGHPQDVLHGLFNNSANLKYEFAINLNRLDVLNPDCFEYKTNYGSSIALLMKAADIRFIVVRKEWSAKGLYFELEVCDEEEVNRAMAKLDSGEYHKGLKGW